MDWNRLRAPQLRDLAHENCLVILPVGSTEQHGPHLPVQVDALLATEVSLGAASRFNPPGKAIVAPTAESLKTQLAAAVSQIIASKLSFTAPAITATLNSDGSLYQAQFDYAQNKEWTGTIKRTKICQIQVYRLP